MKTTAWRSLVLLLVLSALLNISLTVGLAGNIVPFPVANKFYADPRFPDGNHWIFKPSYRGRDFFIDMGPACPISGTEAAGILGGDPNSWSLLPNTGGTGWRYQGPEFSAVVPFGKVDHPTGTSLPGQSFTTPVATLWCNG